MSSTGVDLVNLLQILGNGRALRWSKLANPHVPNFAEGAGISTDVGDGGAVVAVVAAAIGVPGLRTYRVSRITVATLDLTATYSITITTPDGGPMPAIEYDAAADGAADEADVVQGIADAVEAALAGSGVLVSAIDTDDDEVVDTVQIAQSLIGDGIAGIAVAADGTGALALVTDGRCTFRALGLFGGTGADAPAAEWFVLRGAILADDVSVPQADRYAVAGCARVNVIAFRDPVTGDGATAPSTIAYRTPDVWIGLGAPEGRVA